MALKFVQIVVLCVIGVAVTEVTCQNLLLKKLEVENKENDYFGEIVSEITPQDGASAISVTVPIKQELDDQLEMKVSLNFNGIPIVKDYSVKLCDMIAADSAFRPIIDKVEPAGKFPTECPIPAGDWKLSNYVIDISNFIPITPSGDFDGEFDVGLPDKEPIVKVLVSGTVGGSSGAISGIGLSSLFKLL